MIGDGRSNAVLSERLALRMARADFRDPRRNRASWWPSEMAFERLNSSFALWREPLPFGGKGKEGVKGSSGSMGENISL